MAIDLRAQVLRSRWLGPVLAALGLLALGCSSDAAPDPSGGAAGGAPTASCGGPMAYVPTGACDASSSCHFEATSLSLCGAPPQYDCTCASGQWSCVAATGGVACIDASIGCAVASWTGGYSVTIQNPEGPCAYTGAGSLGRYLVNGVDSSAAADGGVDAGSCMVSNLTTASGQCQLDYDMVCSSLGGPELAWHVETTQLDATGTELQSHLSLATTADGGPPCVGEWDELLTRT